MNEEKFTPIDLTPAPAADGLLAARERAAQLPAVSLPAEREKELVDLWKKNKDIDPDRAAKARQWAQKLGRPVEAVYAHLDHIEDPQKSAELALFAASESENPTTVKYMKDADVQPYIKDEYENLGVIERELRSVYVGGKRALLQRELARAGVELAKLDRTFGSNNGPKLARVRELQNQLLGLERRKENRKTFFTGEWAEQMGETTMQVGAGMKEGGIGYALGAGVGALGGAAVAGLSGGSGAAIIPAAAQWGGRIGGLIAMGKDAYTLEAGLAYLDYRDFTDQNGGRIAPELAWQAANSVGLINSFLEVAGDAVIVGTVLKPAGKLVRGVSGRSLSSLMQNPRLAGLAAQSPKIKSALESIAKEPSQFQGLTLADAFKRALVNMAESEGTEATTEFMQEVVSGAGGEAAKTASGQPFADLTDLMLRFKTTYGIAFSDIERRLSELSPEDQRDYLNRRQSAGEILSQASEVIAPTLIGMLPMALAGGASTYYNHLELKARVIAAEQNAAALAKVADKTKIAKRNPDAAQAVIQDMAQDAEIPTTYVNKDALYQVLAAGTQDPAAALGELGITQEWERAQKEQNDFIEIPTGKWTVLAKKVTLNNQTVYEQILRDVKFAPEQLTRNEAAQAESEARSAAVKRLSDALKTDGAAMERAEAMEQQFLQRFNEAPAPAEMTPTQWQESKRAAAKLLGLYYAAKEKNLSITPDETHAVLHMPKLNVVLSARQQELKRMAGALAAPLVKTLTASRAAGEKTHRLLGLTPQELATELEKTQGVKLPKDDELKQLHRSILDELTRAGFLPYERAWNVHGLTREQMREALRTQNDAKTDEKAQTAEPQRQADLSGLKRMDPRRLAHFAKNTLQITGKTSAQILAALQEFAAQWPDYDPVKHVQQYEALRREAWDRMDRVEKKELVNLWRAEQSALSFVWWAIRKYQLPLDITTAQLHDFFARPEQEKKGGLSAALEQFRLEKPDAAPQMLEITSEEKTRLREHQQERQAAALAAHKEALALPDPYQRIQALTRNVLNQTPGLDWMGDFVDDYSLTLTLDLDAPLFKLAAQFQDANRFFNALLTTHARPANLAKAEEYVAFIKDDEHFYGRVVRQNPKTLIYKYNGQTRTLHKTEISGVSLDLSAMLRFSTTAHYFRAVHERIKEERNRTPAETNQRKKNAAPKDKIADVGEELYANKRNRFGRVFSWDDVKDQNDTLKAREITKKNIWPRPDYKQLAADGMNPLIAYRIKMVYDNIAPVPPVRGIPDDEQYQLYITEVNRIKDAVMNWASQRNKGYTSDQLAQYLTSRDKSVAEGLLDNDDLVNALYPSKDGQRRLADENNLKRYHIVNRRNLIYALNLGNYYKTRNEVAKGWPNIQKRTAPQKPRSAGLALENVRVPGPRTGAPRRKDGQDVTAEQLQSVYGFRGVNFGNWTNQKERQYFLNETYDALADLAQVFDIPAKAVSLNGLLGLAFGAQGRSGKAVAHFVPGYNEINLTKTKGAGSLAHEWAHALDHYFATMLGPGLSKSSEPYLSHVKTHSVLYTYNHPDAAQKVGITPSGVRVEVLKAFDEIVRAMTKRPETAEELRLRVNEPLRTTAQISRQMSLYRFYLDRNAKNNDARSAAFQQVDRLEKQLKEQPVRTQEQAAALAQSLLELYQQTTGHHLSERMDPAELEKAIAEMNPELVRPGEKISDYWRNAGELDGGGKKDPYWQKHTEMFARAFAAYLSDKLKESGITNPFLASGEPFLKTPARTVYTTPQGEERQRVAAAFDLLIAQLRHKETERGVALYQMAPNLQAVQDALASSAAGGTLEGQNAYNAKGRADVQSRAFKKWFGRSRVTDAAGQPLEVYHGTVNRFSVFDRARANAEASMGRGFYFSNTKDDSEANYAGIGPDLQNKLEVLAERLKNEDETLTDEQAEQKARERLVEDEDGIMIPVYLSLQNPVQIGGENDTFFNYEYNEETEEESGTAIELMDALREAASEFMGGEEIESVISELFQNAQGVSAAEVYEAVFNAGTLFEDENGNIANGELFRRAMKIMGFDGIIDHDVNKRYGTGREFGAGLPGMDEDTVHYIVFEPTQIKSVYNRGGFDPFNKDIYYQRPASVQYPLNADIIARLDERTDPVLIKQNWPANAEKTYSPKDLREVWTTQYGASQRGATRELINTDTGWTATLSNKAADEIIVSGGREAREYGRRTAFALAANLPELFKKAVLVKSHADTDSSGGVVKIHRFFVPARWEEGLYSVKLTVREFDRRTILSLGAFDQNGEKDFGIYTLAAAKKIVPSGISGKVRENAGIGQPALSTTYSIADTNGNYKPRIKELLDGVSDKSGTYNIDPDGNVLFQRQPRTVDFLGAFEDGAEPVITLSPNANFSTLLHEVAHFLHADLKKTLAQFGANEKIRAQYAEIQKWYGASHDFVTAQIKDDESLTLAERKKLLDTLKERGGEKYVKKLAQAEPSANPDQLERAVRRRFEELFARGLETYLLQGHAPTMGLKGFFANVRKWLLRVYKNALVPGGVQITPEVKNIFDRLLAAEETIDLYANVPNVKDALNSVYLQELSEDEKEQCKQELFRTLMDELKAKEALKLINVRRKAEKKAEEFVRKDPLYKLLDRVRFALKKYPQLAARDFLDGKLGKRDGLAFNAIADMNPETVNDPVEMAQKLAALANPADYVKQAGERAVQDEIAKVDHLNNPAALEKMAKEIILSRERLFDLGLIELRFLEQKFLPSQTAKTQSEGYLKAKKSMFAVLAREYIDSRKLRDARALKRYYGIARQEAVRAALADETDGGEKRNAYIHKWKQLYYMAVANEARKADKDIEKRLRWMHKMQIAPITYFKDVNHFEQVADLLARFGFARRDFRRENKITPLEQYVHDYGEMLSLPRLPDLVMDERVQLLPREMSYEQLKQVSDAIKLLIIAARKSEQVRFQNKLADVKEVIRLAKESLGQNVSLKTLEKNRKEILQMTRTKGPLDFAKDLTAGGAAMLKTMDTLVYRLDGYKDQGVMRDLFYNPVKTMADAESRMLNRFTARIVDVVENRLGRDALKDMQIQPADLGEVMHLNKLQLFTLALNWGNLSNRAVIESVPPFGYEGDLAEWQEKGGAQYIVEDAFARYLTSADWAVIQEIWDSLEEIGAEQFRLEKRLRGFEPPRVEPYAFPIKTKDGKEVYVSGGYYPLIMDQRAISRMKIDEQDKLRENIRKMYHTDRGAMMQRSGVKYPVSLEFTELAREVSASVHDVCFREIVLDLNKLFLRREFAEAFRDAAGLKDNYQTEIYRTMLAGGTGEVSTTQTLDAFINHFRKGLSVSALAFNVRIIVQNLANVFTLRGAVDGFGAAQTFRTALEAAARWPGVLLGTPQGKLYRQQVLAKSQVMADREIAADYTFRQIADYENPLVKSRSWLVKAANFLMTQSDNLIMLPAWQVAYEQGIGELKLSEREAVDRADLLVTRTVGDGRRYTTSSIQRSRNAMARMITPFMSFFNAELNKIVRETGRDMTRKEYGRFTLFCLEKFVLFVVASELLSFRPPEEDEPWRVWWLKAVASYTAGLTPFTRDLQGVLTNDLLGFKGGYYGAAKSPVSGAIERGLLRPMSTAAKTARKVVKGEEVDWYNVAEHGLQSASILTPYPMIFNNVFLNFAQIYNDEMEFRASDLFQRRPKRERN